MELLNGYFHNFANNILLISIDNAYPYHTACVLHPFYTKILSLYGIY